jgi:hypothetical protein
MVNTNDSISSENLNASTELQDLIEEWITNFTKSSELVKAILEQAEKEGIDKITLRTLIAAALKRSGLKDRRIREILPKELKLEYQYRNPLASNTAKSAVIDDKKVIVVLDAAGNNTEVVEKKKERENDNKEEKREYGTRENDENWYIEKSKPDFTVAPPVQINPEILIANKKIEDYESKIEALEYQLQNVRDAHHTVDSTRVHVDCSQSEPVKGG